MLLSKTIKFKVKNNYDVNYLKKLNIESNINDIIDLSVNNLTLNSKAIVLAKCDFCENEKETSFSSYNRNFKNKNMYACCKQCAYFKVKITLLERYGSDNYNNMDKNKETCLKKYGVLYALQSKEIQEVIKQSLLEKYNVINVSQIDAVKLKKIEKCLEKYGVENISQHESIKLKKVKKCLEKYGVEHVMQNIDIFNRAQETRLLLYKYKNTNLYYQASYELDFLDKYYDKLTIEDGPSIKFIFNLKNKMYYSDFYIPNLNLIVEIKSDYTYNKYLEKNIAKQKACIEQGYNFIFIINKDYTEFDQLFVKL